MLLMKAQITRKKIDPPQMFFVKFCEVQGAHCNILFGKKQ